VELALGLAHREAPFPLDSLLEHGAHAVLVEIAATASEADGLYRGLLSSLAAFQAGLASGANGPIAVPSLQLLRERRASGRRSLWLGTDLANLEGEPALAPVLARLGFRWVVVRTPPDAAVLEAALAERFTCALPAATAWPEVVRAVSPCIGLARSAAEVGPDLVRAVAGGGGVVSLAPDGQELEALPSLIERIGEDYLALAPTREVARRLVRSRSRPSAAHKLLGGNLMRVLALRSGEVHS
jgi:hypothetical protein